MKIPFLSDFIGRSGGEAARAVACFRGNEVLFVRLNRAGKQLKVQTYAVKQLKELSASELAKSCSSMNTGGWRFSTLLESNQYQIMTVDAPNVPEEELKSAIRWRIKESLSYHIDDATIDVLQIPNSKKVGERAQSLYAISANNDVIKRRIALFEDAKLDLDIIDIPEMAQRNIAALFEDEGRGLALLAFDDNGGMLTFTGGGELYLARRFEISQGQLQDADESLRLQALDRLELEMQRSMDYFDRNFNHIAVSRLLVALPNSAELIERLRNNLDAPVERLDLSQVLDLSEVPGLESEEAQVDALYALGAALRLERRAL